MDKSISSTNSVTSAYRKVKILENTNIYENVFKMVIDFPSNAKAGQFCMLRNWALSPILSRPISICDSDEKTLTFLYIVIGKGTKLLSEQKPDEFIHVLGPLGNGFNLESVLKKSQGDDIQEYQIPNSSRKRVALISGGIGIAPLLLLAKNLFKNNIEVDLYAGFRDLNYFTDEFQPYVSGIKISSENAMAGVKGNVLTIFEDKKYSAIYACGPNKMLQAIQSHIQANHMSPLQLSLEAHMACGIGACLGCTVKTKNGMSRVCVEGPVFDSKEVIFHD